MSSDNIVELDSMRPHIVIKAKGAVHVLPRLLLEEVADGRRGVSDMDDWEEIMSAIVTDWLNTL